MVPPLSFVYLVFDVITIFFIFVCILLSVFSLCLIFHFHLKTRNSCLLKDFGSLWAVRTLLVLFICLWALSELLRLPFLRRYIFPLCPFFTQTHQANLCKVHIVLSLGFFEPGFLVTLLFIVAISVRKKTHDDTFATAVWLVLASCFPILLLQVFFVFFLSKEAKFHEFVHNDLPMGAAVLCAYPLLGTIIFGIFGIVYVLSFLISCWRVVSLVINKRLRFRVYTLGIAVLFAVSMQVLLLGISESWQPNDPIFEGLTFGMFLSVLACAVVAECILVIRPIADALALEAGMSSRLDSSIRFHRGVDVHVNTSSQLG